MKVVLVGAAASVEYALRGLLRAGADIAAVFTVDLNLMIEKSGMEPGYFSNLLTFTQRHGFPCYTVKEMNSELVRIKEFHPDVLYIIGWPQLISKEILEIPTWGCVGMHPAPLPQRRGGAPLNWMIIDEVKEGAVTLFKLGSGIDDGPILAQRDYSIGPDEYINTLLEKVNCITEDMVCSLYREMVSGELQIREQDENEVTYTWRRRPENGLINWMDSSRRIYNLIRAVSHPFPGAFTHLHDKKLIIWQSSLVKGLKLNRRAEPGTIIGLGHDGILISTLDYCLEITEIQLADGQVLSGESLKEKLRPYIDERFGG